MSSLLQKIEERRKIKSRIPDSREAKGTIFDETEKPAPKDEPPVKKPKLDDVSEQEKTENEKASANPENFTIIRNVEFKKIQKVNYFSREFISNNAMIFHVLFIF